MLINRHFHELFREFFLWNMKTPLLSRAPNDGFLLNEVKTLFRLPCGAKKNSEKYYLFGHPRIIKPSKLQGLQYYLPEKFKRNLKFFENENFPDSSLHRIFGFENFGFLFSTKNSLTEGVNWEKLWLWKIVGNILDTLRKFYMNGTVI